MATDVEIYRGVTAGGEMGAIDSNLLVRDIVRELFTVPLDDAATAGTAVAEKIVYTAIERGAVSIARKVLVAGVVTTVGGLPVLSTTVAVTANNTNFATVTLFRRRAGVQTTIGAISTTITAVGGTTTWGNVNLVVTGDTQLEVGDQVTASVTKTAAGVALGAAGQPALLTFGIEKN